MTATLDDIYQLTRAIARKVGVDLAEPPEPAPQPALAGTGVSNT